jgi:tetraacyldisaccharide 4'-kinase
VILRAWAYRLRLLPSRRLAAPVIVVGNVTVGGTGKTPLVIWLAGRLRAAGHRPGIVSRGYGGRARYWPQQVRPDSDPAAVGDEAVLIARRTGCPMAVGPDRVAAAEALLAHTDCDVILADDGLQHYRLRRDIEIAVIDGRRRFGNGRCLPAGPLREPAGRLRRVDFRVCNGDPEEGEYGMALTGDEAVSLADPAQRRTLSSLPQPLHAVAGIGHPERFFDALAARGLECDNHAFADHHPYAAGELDFDAAATVLMTEKDAVKYGRHADARHWYVPVSAQPEAAFGERVLQRLQEVNNG